MALEVKKGRWLKEWFDNDGNAVVGENHPFDEWTEPSLIDSGKLRNLEGKLLTIIDATFQDKYQREAQKSIIRNTVWDWWFKYNSIPKIGHDDTADEFPAAFPTEVIDGQEVSVGWSNPPKDESMTISN